MSDKKPVQAPKGTRYFKEPMLVRYAEATRFLWGDAESGQVSDVIYGRGDRIASLVFSLAPGGWFKASKTWKPLFDQHRFYYVIQGSLTIHDPESGEVAVAGPGEAVYWHGAKWHFGYNFGQEETKVLDWYAPAERAAHIPEVEFGKTKPELKSVANGRYGLLGQWPAKAPEERTRLLREGGMVTLGRRDALHLIHGDRVSTQVSLYISTDVLTAGVMDLLPGVWSEPEAHPGDEVLYVTKGRLHVYLPDSFDWFEVHPHDSMFIPEGTHHQYVNYGDAPVEFAFAVSPMYR